MRSDAFLICVIPFLAPAGSDGAGPGGMPTTVEKLGESVAATARPGAIESSLRAMAESGSVPPDFRVFYDDVHGLWGGTELTVRTDGTAVRTIVERGTRRESSATAKKAKLVDLAKRLVEIRAWEPSPHGGAAAPDSSMAKLTVHAGGQSAVLSEPFNHLAKSDRILRVKKEIEALFP